MIMDTNMSDYQLEETETTINVKSYSQGYKDGYNAAMKFYVQDQYIGTHPDHMLDALSSVYMNTILPGANGPTGEVSRR